MPSKQNYIQFKNVQNTIKNVCWIFADVESELVFNKENNSYKHEFLMGAYKLDCVNKVYEKPVQVFNTLESFRDNLIKELDYIDDVNKYLQYNIDMSTFNQKEFNETTICKYCNHNFNKNYNNRKITLVEKIDKYKLRRIIDDCKNNNINEETQANLIKYYNSLNSEGEIHMSYKQHNGIGQYYAENFSLQGMFNEVRSSILHKKSLDIDFVNSIVTIIIYLAKKHNLEIPNIIKYSEDRENIFKK